jgi:hypothetical protein
MLNNIKKGLHCGCAILVIYMVSCSASEDNEPIIDDQPIVNTGEKDDYIQNNQFEEYIDFSGFKGVWEIFGGGNDNNATATYKEDLGYKKTNTIQLRADERSDIAVSQYLKNNLEYRKLYRLSGRIKTENVSGEGGANLNLIGTWSRTDYVKGTEDWTYVHIDFFGPKQGKVAIGSRLGFWYADATGVAYYDNLRITEPDDVYVKKGEHVEIYLGKDLVYGTDEQMQDWLNRLDNFYTAYVDLFKGKQPYEGQTILVQSNPGNPYWAFAGEFIQWNENYVNGALKQVVEQGDACFGIIHEIAHDFAPGNWDEYNENWNWDEEVMANFRMAYALEVLNETVVVGDQKWVGADIINFYKTAYNKSLGQNSINQSMGDAILYTLLRITEEFGWQPIKDAFLELYHLNKGFSPGASKWQKFEFFLETLSKHTGEDVRITYTDSELQTIETFLKQ